MSYEGQSQGAEPYQNDQPAYDPTSGGAVPPPPSPVAYASAVPAGQVAGAPLMGAGLPAGVTLAGPGIRLGSYFLNALLVNVTVVIGWLIWALIIVGKAQTPGKQVVNLRVVDSVTLQPVTFGRMFFMRGIVGGLVAAVLAPLTLGIILFMPFWDDNNQNIWDKVSGTYVVSDPFNAWGL